MRTRSSHACGATRPGPRAARGSQRPRTRPSAPARRRSPARSRGRPAPGPGRRSAARARSRSRTTSWRGQRGTTASSRASASARPPSASSTRASPTPPQNGSSTRSAQLLGLLDPAGGEAQQRSPSAPTTSARPVRRTRSRTNSWARSKHSSAAATSPSSSRSCVSWSIARRQRVRDRAAPWRGGRRARSRRGRGRRARGGRAPRRCPSSADRIVIEPTATMSRTPAAMRSASSGRPASASPSAWMPSYLSRRSGSVPSSRRICSSCPESSSQRSLSAPRARASSSRTAPARRCGASSPSSAIDSVVSSRLLLQSPVTVAATDCSIVSRPVCVRFSPSGRPGPRRPGPSRGSGACRRAGGTRRTRSGPAGPSRRG